MGLLVARERAAEQADADASGGCLPLLSRSRLTLIPRRV